MIKIKKISLIWQVLIAISVAVPLGLYCAPDWLVRLFNTFNLLISQLISFIVPLLVLSLIVPAIVQTKEGAGKMLLYTLCIAYASTVIIAFISYLCGDAVFPYFVTPVEADITSVDKTSYPPFVKIGFPPFMDVMSALLLSFIIGLCCLKIKAPVVIDFFLEFKEIIMMTISKAIIPLLPIYIFGNFLNMSKTGDIVDIAGNFVFVILFIVVLSILWIIFQYLIAGIVARRNPFKMLGTMLPAFVMAFASASSAATLPVSLAQAHKMGVKDNVADFVIPMCSNIHLSGASLRTIALAVAIMIMYNVPFDIMMFTSFILVFSITVVAAPGVPGGVIMSSIGLLTTMLGFNEPMLAIMVPLSIVLDNIGTAVNVTGDGAVMVIVDRLMGRSDLKMTENIENK
ncbi:MAG: dicarboxylate/amino acid:cation symporter [Paludibacteraceae bacterium]|nr:dicarboxylate/amino acid:cation symporter [Paludibacteraceae bacterium]